MDQISLSKEQIKNIKSFLRTHLNQIKIHENLKKEALFYEGRQALEKIILCIEDNIFIPFKDEYNIVQLVNDKIIELNDKKITELFNEVAKMRGWFIGGTEYRQDAGMKN